MVMRKSSIVAVGLGLRIVVNLLPASDPLAEKNGGPTEQSLDSEAGPTEESDIAQIDLRKREDVSRSARDINHTNGRSTKNTGYRVAEQLRSGPGRRTTLMPSAS